MLLIVVIGMSCEICYLHCSSWRGVCVYVVAVMVVLVCLLRVLLFALQFEIDATCDVQCTV